MDAFSKFIPKSMSLDPIAIVDNKLCAVPFPEVISGPEIVELGKMCRESTATLWSYGYGNAPKKFEGYSLEKISSLSFSESYNSLFIALENSSAYIWQPDNHEYFVIFGTTHVVNKIVNSGILTYSFDEYVNEKYFQDKRADPMKEIQRKYTIRT